ncbi:MAG TPA: hypothetical protein DD713_05280, partial [Nitrospiraceae bacterium]|nr:hypothetical protein [Nitrospiraceae bacterium]
MGAGFPVGGGEGAGAAAAGGVSGAHAGWRLGAGPALFRAATGATGGAGGESGRRCGGGDD